MTGLKRSGKTTITTHTSNPRLTPATTADVTEMNPESGSTPQQRSGERVGGQASLCAKDGAAFPLMEGIDANKVREAAEKARQQEAQQRQLVGFVDAEAFLALGGGAKPEARLLELENATVRVVSVPQHKRVAALKRR